MTKNQEEQELFSQNQECLHDTTNWASKDVSKNCISFLFLLHRFLQRYVFPISFSRLVCMLLFRLRYFNKNLDTFVA